MKDLNKITGSFAAGEGTTADMFALLEGLENFFQEKTCLSADWFFLMAGVTVSAIRGIKALLETQQKNGDIYQQEERQCATHAAQVAFGRMSRMEGVELIRLGMCVIDIDTNTDPSNFFITREDFLQIVSRRRKVFSVVRNDESVILVKKTNENNDEVSEFEVQLEDNRVPFSEEVKQFLGV